MPFSDTDVDPSILRRYELENQVGKGSYGVVWSAKDKRTGEQVAVKKCFDAFRNKTDAQRTYREVTYLQKLRHENIVAIKSISLSSDGKGLATALKYIHSANLIHRDLKPSNILIDRSCRVTLADFGLIRSIADADAAHQQGRHLTDYVATRWYRSPEVLLGSTRYSKGSDIWSFGLIAAEMIRGRALFPGGSTMNQIERILEYTGRPTPEDIKSTESSFAETMINDGLPASAGSKPRVSLSRLCKGTGAPSEALDLLRCCLQFNPKKRKSAESLLRHAYVKDFHDKKKEPSYDDGPIQIAISDDVKLSPSDYRDALSQQIETQQSLEALKEARDKARRRGSLAAITAEPALIDEMSRMDVQQHD